MFPINQTNRFKKELKLMIRRGKQPQKIWDTIDLLKWDVIDTLKDNNSNLDCCLLLPKKYCLHKISNGYWECHIEPDWLLIFSLNDSVLQLERTGTHSDLCGKVVR
jgi:mRNA interferase YafQ